MNEINKLNPLLEAMNDIDDAIISESAPAKRKRPMRFKPLIVAAAAVVLCGATAVTAAASLKPSKEVIVEDEPVDVDYTVYIDDLGREIRTYAFNIPDYALGEEKEGCTAVGQVKVVPADDDNPWGNWSIVDEEGTVFHSGINNKEIQCDVIDPKNPHTHCDIEFVCANFNSKDYDMIMYNGQDKIYLYVYPFGDKEAAKRIYEKHGDELNEEIFDRMCEHHRRLYPDS